MKMYWPNISICIKPIVRRTTRLWWIDIYKPCHILDICWNNCNAKIFLKWNVVMEILSVLSVVFDSWLWIVLSFFSLFRSGATVSEVSGGKFNVKRIRNGITYYCTPLSQTEEQTRPTKVSASPRPLLLFFSWLGAQPGGVAKYRDVYLDRGMDVLLVQSSVMHFLWPQWGLDYGLEILKVLEEPLFSERDLLVHATSIGGYTFTHMLTHMAHGPKKYAQLGQRVTGHIYDSLVAGSLEHMAVGEWDWSNTDLLGLRLPLCPIRVPEL